MTDGGLVGALWVREDERGGDKYMDISIYTPQTCSYKGWNPWFVARSAKHN